jgi:hypothetical protein
MDHKALWLPLFKLHILVWGNLDLQALCSNMCGAPFEMCSFVCVLEIWFLGPTSLCEAQALA